MPLGVIFLSESQSAKSGVFCKTSDTRSCVLLALRGMIEVLSLGTCDGSDVAHRGR